MTSTLIVATVPINETKPNYVNNTSQVGAQTHGLHATLLYYTVPFTPLTLSLSASLDNTSLTTFSCNSTAGCKRHNVSLSPWPLSLCSTTSWLKSYCSGSGHTWAFQHLCNFFSLLFSQHLPASTETVVFSGESTSISVSFFPTCPHTKSGRTIFHRLAPSRHTSGCSKADT